MTSYLHSVVTVILGLVLQSQKGAPGTLTPYNPVPIQDQRANFMVTSFIFNVYAERLLI